MCSLKPLPSAAPLPTSTAIAVVRAAWSELRSLPAFADLLRDQRIRINVRYKRSRLGIVWAMLQPLSMMVVFTLVVGLLGGAPTKATLSLFAYTGVLLWSAF